MLKCLNTDLLQTNTGEGTSWVGTGLRGPQLMELTGQSVAAASGERKHTGCTGSRAQAGSNGQRTPTRTARHRPHGPVPQPATLTLVSRCHGRRSGPKHNTENDVREDDGPWSPWLPSLPSSWGTVHAPPRHTRRPRRDHRDRFSHTCMP